MKSSDLTPEEHWYYAPMYVKIMIRLSIAVLAIIGALEKID